MSKLYDEYLVEHKLNVFNAFKWIRDNLSSYFAEDCEWQLEYNHDTSKTSPEEYEAYDKYFYGGNRSYGVVTNFNYAWLHHIHNNPHHWQHWVLQNDDPEAGTICLEIPFVYILEMICDWWSFSWKTGDLMSIFTWYDEHKDYIQMHDASRKQLERILEQMKEKLEELNG